MHWTSTLSNVASKIKHVFPQPVGVVLLGVDSEFKEGVLQQLLLMLGRIRLQRDSDPPMSSRGVVVVMDGVDSSDPGKRAETIQELRMQGAQTVVGIYARVNRLAEDFLQELDRRDLAASPPAEEEFDHLIVIDDDF